MPDSLSYGPRVVLVGQSGKSGTRPGPAGGVNIRILLFFISGNPGLIDYYAPFLSTLGRLLHDSERDLPLCFSIYGMNLAGFDDGDHEPFSPDHPPRGLEFQIQDTLKHLSALVIGSGGSQGEVSFDHVILVGHSVGAYIALEIFHRHLQDPASSPRLPLKAGILLFPTISHIAKSSNGKRLDLIRRTPYLRDNAHHIAQGFLRLWPAWALRWFVRVVLRFPPHAEDATMRFLTSRDGIWQAIHMGKDEMSVIAEDIWAEELWEIDEAVARMSDAPKFVFYFGRNDHWVANECRDEFIARRESQESLNKHDGIEGPLHKLGRTRILVDESDVPHAFCIHHSEVIAEKVKVWVEEIVGQL